MTKIKRYQQRPLGEQNTKASLIEPLFEALGWDVRDADEVHREYKSRPADKPVDYALQMLRKPRLFVEAKGLGEHLADRKWVSQILSYAAVAGVTWCVLTDGDEYRFYNANAPVDAEEKLFCQLRLSEGNSEQHAKTLDLISRSNMEGNLLDQFWEAHFVDRNVNAVLKTLLSTADRGLVRLIRRATRTTNGLTPKEIADSILRLNFSIESPLGWNPITSTRQQTAPPPREKVRPKKPAKTNNAKRDFGVSLSEIIGAGVISTPLPLFRKYKGELMKAMLQKDGSVDFRGQNFASCSRAAEFARSTVTGRRMNTNGWSFWQYTDSAGVKRELTFAREQFITKRNRG